MFWQWALLAILGIFLSGAPSYCKSDCPTQLTDQWKIFKKKKQQGQDPESTLQTTGWTNYYSFAALQQMISANNRKYRHPCTILLTFVDACWPFPGSKPLANDVQHIRRQGLLLFNQFQDVRWIVHLLLLRGISLHQVVPDSPSPGRVVM